MLSCMHAHAQVDRWRKRYRSANLSCLREIHYCNLAKTLRKDSAQNVRQLLQVCASRTCPNRRFPAELNSYTCFFSTWISAFLDPLLLGPTEAGEPLKRCTPKKDAVTTNPSFCQHTGVEKQQFLFFTRNHVKTNMCMLNYIHT